MTPNIYSQGHHSPCEHYAHVAYDAIVAAIPDSAYTDPAAGYPTDEDAPDWHEQCDRWLDARALAAIIGDDPPTSRKRKEEPVSEAGEKEPPYTVAGITIRWHNALPDLRVWAGAASLQTLLDGRRAALHTAALPLGTRLLDWTIPYPTVSGLDPRTTATALDIGFSPAKLGMPVACYAAAEILMCVGLEIAPITRLGRQHYGYQDDGGEWWEYRVVQREGHHRMLTMAKRGTP